MCGLDPCSKTMGASYDITIDGSITKEHCSWPAALLPLLCQRYIAPGRVGSTPYALWV